ncbi:floral homeotic protein AGAMOUS-like [Vicia villosa]|uniref:floral homeotic protein AGAMOUS-like n=1 Tax=Vicia villosa TaxID=3911 RepID=UPI00273CD098|nr:floral homeotic protein AGAMOUS-like [Vicia villosa]
MGRGRITMELIQNEKARKTTFHKRKNGLLKKVNEFSILCDVDICVILYAPNFEGQGYVEPETWPRDTKEVERILEKYYNTTSDRRPKIYDVHEYYKERVKKIEFEVSKVRKDKLKLMYPTWDPSFDSIGGEDLRLLARILDAKLDACNQKMNMLKGDFKEKAIAQESHKVDQLMNAPYIASNSSNYYNLMQNNVPQPQIYPPPLININDKNLNSLGFFPFQIGQSSQSSSMLTNTQGCSYQVEPVESRYTQPYPYKQIDTNCANWSNQVNANVTYEPSIGTMKNNEAVENNENVLPYYYNGNAMQSYPIAMHTLPHQNHQNLPHGYQLNGFYDMDFLQGHHIFNYTDGRK